MTIQSMTGFAREAGVSGARQWTWEVKSVNGRGLDVRPRNPTGFDDVGEEARRTLATAFQRGNFQLTLTLARIPGAGRVRINGELLGQLVQALNRITVPDGVRPASMDALLAVRGVVETEDESAGDAFDGALKAELRAGAGRLIDALRAARSAEGEMLARTLAGQLDRIVALTDAAESCPARRPDAVKARLAAQVASLVGTGASLDSQRLHQEAVLLATRADIREELDRLRAHLTAARDLLDKGGVIGRRLDFLAQEFGRESNTLCAKANDVSLSQIGLDLKAVVEQFREQVQNVE